MKHPHITDGAGPAQIIGADKPRPLRTLVGFDDVQGRVIRRNYDAVGANHLRLGKDALNTTIRIDPVDAMHTGLLWSYVSPRSIGEINTAAAVEGQVVGLMKLLAIVAIGEDLDHTGVHVGPRHPRQHRTPVTAFAGQQSPFAVEDQPVRTVAGLAERREYAVGG